MIESIVSAFTKNSFIFSGKGGSGGGDFQEALAQHDQQQLSTQEQSSNKFDNSFQYKQDDQYKPEEYEEASSSYDKEASSSYDKEANSSYDKEANSSYDKEADESVKAEVATEESSRTDESEDVKELDILAFLKELGLNEENLKLIKDLIANPDKMPNDEVLNKLLAELKTSLSKDMPPEFMKKMEAFSEKFQQLLKEGHKHVSKELKQMLDNSATKQNTQKAIVKEGASEFRHEVDGQDKVDKQIKHNNSKHAAMKEVSQDMKNVKFNTEIDPRFTQDTKKSNQAFQARQAQFHAQAGNSSAKQQGGAGQQQNGGEASMKSPNFIKKMKTILKSNAQNTQNADFSLNQQSKVQGPNIKPSFMNRVSTGQFMQQLVDKIQSMVKAGTTLSASVDLKSAEFGDMKLAAEAQGTNLAVKLSNIASTMKADIVSLKGELDAELKNLGFENVELDFGTGSENGSHSNAFEHEMQKRLSGEHVKLPGDQLADLKLIDEWLKGFEKVM